MKKRLLLLLLVILLLLPAIQTGAAVTVYGWGRGWYDQLGPAGEEKTFHPVRIPLPADVIAVKSGSSFGLALDAAGRVWGWGRGQMGATGRVPPPANPEANFPQPAVVPGLPIITQIAAGEEVALALAADGTVWVWGEDTFGIHGYGNQMQPQLPPHRVPGLNNIVRIAMSSAHGLALRADGTVWAWGNNAFGECGLDPQVNDHRQAGHITPRQMQNLANIVAIATGENTSYALRVDGVLFAWGRDISAATQKQYEPVAVSGSVKVAQISTAPWTGYIKDVNGGQWAIGDHGGGCLNATATCTRTTWLERMAKLPPVTILTGNYSVALAVRPDGSLLVWGDNYYGGLGQPYTGTARSPIPLPGITGVFAADAGYYTPMVATGLKCHAQLSADGRELQVIKANILGRAYYLKFVYQPAGGQVRYQLVDFKPVPAGACGSEAILLADGGGYLLHLPWVEWQGQYFWVNFDVRVEGGQVFVVYRNAGQL
ncbi:MAG: hypothetical protein JRJ56_06500 [Deltaproteobacteria bacterium]|nr:hypothetical protein [Deltaproteobacteria bacterium]